MQIERTKLTGKHKQSVSVAMATYNGEKYIEEQLLSIIFQTESVDEIIISDDGSSDQTLLIIERFIKEYPSSNIKLFTDNERHGFNGNFEHAVSLCSGDIIFLCDQDDVWEKNKVESITKVFFEYNNCSMVIHDCMFIDGEGNKLEGEFCPLLEKNHMVPLTNEIYKMPIEYYLERSVSGCLANGMAIAFKRNILTKTTVAWPKILSDHDHWIIFLALCNGDCFFYNSPLGKYRLHGNNTAGSALYKGTYFDRLRRVRKRVNNGLNNDNLYLGTAINNYLKRSGMEDTEAFFTSKRLIEIGTAKKAALLEQRFKGIIQLSILYRNDIRYRCIGRNGYLVDILTILLISRNRRKKLYFEKYNMAEVEMRE